MAKRKREWTGLVRTGLVRTGLARTGLVRTGRHAAAAIAVAALVAPGSGLAASKEDRVFTIGNYPLEAREANAVAAKEKAISEGQQAALRTLLKRLVPVTAYKRLGQLKGVKAGELIESFAVRSERNSSTTYIASYDFVFSPEPVRRLLDKEGIPYLDRQAPQVTIVPAYRVTPELAKTLPASYSAAAGSDAWLYAWKALDLANTLTPASLQPLKPEVHADTVKAVAQGDVSMLRTLAQAYGTETVVLAVLEPEAGQKKITVTLAGRDAVQTLHLKRTYRLDYDLAYTAELAAVISLAILEGRWKAINVRGAPVNSAAAASWQPGVQPGGSAPIGGGAPGFAPTSGALSIAVTFQGMAEWQEISRQLAHTPEVAGLEVLGLSARRARVSLSYPGGAQNLALALAQQGLILENTREGWVLTRR